MNTSKSFVRACFWPGKDLVISGSEDASVCLWDSESCHMVQRLKGHTVGSAQRRYRLPNAATARRHARRRALRYGTAHSCALSFCGTPCISGRRVLCRVE